VYCDSTSSLDRYNCPTFIMSTCTSAGGIPLGVVFTSGESEEVITAAILAQGYISNKCILWQRTSLVPRPFPPPVFDCLQYANTEGEVLGDLVTCGYVK